MSMKTLLHAGWLAAGVYVVTVLAGGFLYPGYSHLAQPVSDLIASDAPNKLPLDLAFGLYNALTLVAGWGVWQFVRAASVPRRALGRVGAALLLAEGVFGLITLFFPEDSADMAVIGPIGTLHIVFAALSSLATMLTMLLLGFWFRATPARRALGLYSFLSVLFVFISGGLAAYGVANHHPLAGLFERGAIGGFLQWLAVVGWRLAAEAQPAPAAAVPAARQA